MRECRFVVNRVRGSDGCGTPRVVCRLSFMTLYNHLSLAVGDLSKTVSLTEKVQAGDGD